MCEKRNGDRMNLTDSITQLNHIIEYIYKREFERAHWEHRDVPFPEHVDKQFNEIKQMYTAMFKIVAENNKRLVKEVNKDGN
jgi:hypothetical protein